MIAGIYNITCEQGATFTRTFTIYNPDKTIFDLTGFSGRMQVRRDFDTTTSMIDLTTANGRMSMTPSLGEITINLTAAETATIPRDGVYDLEIFKADGTVHRVVKGLFKLDKEVTR